MADSIENTVSDSTTTRSRVAARAIAQDAANESQLGHLEAPQPSNSLQRINSNDMSMGYSMGGSYRRPSFMVAGTTRSTFLPISSEQGSGYLTKDEENAVIEEERSLLRDNNFIPPKHPRAGSQSSRVGGAGRSIITALRRKASGTGGDASASEQPLSPPEDVSETTALISGQNINPSLPYGGQDDPEIMQSKWNEAVESGKIQTTWQRETKILSRYSRSLILTFALQYSIFMVSVFAVGHLGVVELGAVSLGSMTANITGISVMQGLATSLDTLCAQAYGSGEVKLVGLQTQRMIYFLWACLIPIGAIWLSGTAILYHIVPDRRTAELAGLYLKVALIGTPGYAAFEAGKRFVQAQGLFTANLYVLLIVAPLNILLHWLFVWHLKLGFVGAPLSVAIVELLMPILLLLYIYFIDGRQCWGGFSKAALQNWWPMIRLAIPGLVMVLAEFLAFEILTFGASWISTDVLAAQSVISMVSIFTYQIPFPISVAGSTRIANLIGAGLPDAAKTSAKVVFAINGVVGIFNMILVSSLRFYIPRLFTNDETVIIIIGQTLPLCAAFQFFDAIAAAANGVLRGIGRQKFGGYVGLGAYYGVAMPLSFGLAFGAHLGLIGLWIGPAVALMLVAFVEGGYISRIDWKMAVDEAQKRIRSG